MIKYASSKQISFIQSLLNKKVWDEKAEEFDRELTKSYSADYDSSSNTNNYFYHIEAEVASEMIEHLLTLEDEAVRPITEKQYALLNSKKGNKFLATKGISWTELDSMSFEKASALISEMLKK